MGNFRRCSLLACSLTLCGCQGPPIPEGPGDAPPPDSERGWREQIAAIDVGGASDDDDAPPIEPCDEAHPERTVGMLQCDPRSEPGYTLFAPILGRTTYLIDVLGRVVHSWAAPYMPANSVYLLAFHVDYWNRLGWVDRFSDASFSDRQRRYARALGGRVYTPQMIVEGRDVFVGSRRVAAIAAISKQLEQSDEATITLQVGDIGKGVMDVAYDVNGSLAGRVLNVALVEDGIVSSIRAGENKGLTLQHDRVVRRFEAIDVSKGNGHGRVRLDLPEDAVIDRLSVIAYLQDGASMAVAGAVSVRLPATESEE